MSIANTANYEKGEGYEPVDYISKPIRPMGLLVLSLTAWILVILIACVALRFLARIQETILIHIGLL